tara:strand:- start:104 stop:376 length:273 start_codon:yes stop_codon:yes gene_type:complete
MKNNIIMKYAMILPTLCLLGCIIVLPPEELEPKDCVNPEGPWYGDEYLDECLDENPERISDIYRCNNYWEWEQQNKDTAPIACPGPKDCD